MWPGNATRRVNPAATLVAGEFALQAGPDGVTLGRFAWADLVAGLVSNAYSAGQQIGFAIAQYGMAQWQRVYWRRRQPILRAGMGITLAAHGDFRIRFADGAAAGSPVWANPADGTASGTDLGGFVLTPWTVMQNVCPCGVGRISSSAGPFSQPA